MKCKTMGNPGIFDRWQVSVHRWQPLADPLALLPGSYCFFTSVRTLHVKSECHSLTKEQLQHTQSKYSTMWISTHNKFIKLIYSVSLNIYICMKTICRSISNDLKMLKTLFSLWSEKYFFTPKYILNFYFSCVNFSFQKETKRQVTFKNAKVIIFPFSCTFSAFYLTNTKDKSQQIHFN